jgi:hypothetical protein
VGAAGVLGAALAADDTAADGDAELLAAAVSETGVEGLFDADAAAMITISAPTAISPVSNLCRAGQDFRFGWGCCGMKGGCCPGGTCGGYCWFCGGHGWLSCPAFSGQGNCG